MKPGRLVWLLPCALPSVAAFCSQSCNGHGTCGEHDFCTCFDDWTGFNCNDRVCPFGVSWVTRDGLDLFDMSTPNYPAGLHAYEECSGVGACDRATGICDCAVGYTGLGCRRAECPNGCSGNGICVAAAEVAPGGYGADARLQYQRMYWDRSKSTQCLCDTGYEGIDCSVRICPHAASLGTSCDTAFHHDVQAVTVSFADSFAGMTTAQLDNYFTLEFTDTFNGKTRTRPISFWDDALAVQEALYALPNYALSDISVTKIWPLQDYTESSDSDAYVSGSTLEADDAFRNLACETWYFDAFEDPSCTVDADCEDKFGLAAGTNVVCETTLNICVETEGAACLVDDAIDEFVSDGCASSFTPDGIYVSAVIGGSFWGRRLGSFERKCHIGLFETDDPHYAVKCSSNADCVACAGNTQVTAGECDTVTTGLCVPSTEFRSTFITADLEECSVAAFIVNFDAEQGGSRKNLFTCSTGEDTNTPGASPRYESSSLASCSALHIGLPEWRISNYGSGLNDLCWSRDSGTGVATNEYVGVDDVAAYEAAGGFCYDLDSTTASELNLVVEDQNAHYAKQPDLGRALSWPGVTLFTAESITDLFDMDFAVDLPCSHSGKCQEDTGLCVCGNGYTGVACELTVAYL